jgi:hypothetical protein
VEKNCRKNGHVEIGGEMGRSGVIGDGTCLGPTTGPRIPGDFFEFAGEPREAGAQSQTGPSLSAGI